MNTIHNYFKKKEKSFLINKKIHNILIYYLLSLFRQTIDIKYWNNKIELNRFPIFDTVLIETRTDCNRKCSFCPQSIYTRPLEIMSEDVFEKIITNLSKINFSGRLGLFVTNEPLLDKRITKLIFIAKKTLPNVKIDINTNGNLLDLDLTNKLFESGIDYIKIDDYRKDRHIFPNKLSKNIKKIYDSFKDDKRIDFRKRLYEESLSNRGGSMDSKQDKTPKNKAKNIFCSDPFTRIVFSPNGDVVLCCMDYNFQEKLGNIMQSDIINIWNSENFLSIRKSLIAKDRSNLCAKCNKNEYSGIFDRILIKKSYYIKRFNYIFLKKK